jgi:hypothetical protein
MEGGLEVVRLIADERRGRGLRAVAHQCFRQRSVEKEERHGEFNAPGRAGLRRYGWSFTVKGISPSMASTPDMVRTDQCSV